MGRFMPGSRISQAHGTTRIADPATGARDATVFAMYHPAAALRTPSIERESYGDVALIPTVLTDARARRAEARRAARTGQSAPMAAQAGAAAGAGAPAAGAAAPPTLATAPDPTDAAGQVDPPGTDPTVPTAQPAPVATLPDAEPAADQLSLF
jgi:hypothetical protein